MVSSLLIVILYSAYKTSVSVHRHINSKGGGNVRVSRVWQLIRRVINESILVAFSAFALWPAIAPADNVICETKPCKLTDITSGEQVTVTVEKQQGRKTLATKIEARKVTS
jgi:hypothetical protein